MISSLSPSSLSFLYGIQQTQNRLLQDQQQLTTGLKINSVADAPGQIPELMQTQAQLAHTQQVNSNLVNVTNEVNTAESSLQSAVTLFNSAQTLASQGETGFASATTRQQVAGQLGDILQQLVGVANTSVEGRYIFGGNSDQTQPYTIDLTQTNPISAYAGSAATRQVESPDGTTFAVAQTAQDIFDSPDAQNNVFQAINNVRQALLNNDQSAIDAALPNMQSANTYLNQQLAFYGQVQDRVTNATNYGNNLVTQLQTQLSNLQDANMAEAMTNFTQDATAQQAALAARSKMPTSTLFDYLG
jgi:flagellar hook-associated protein 3 FlgL